MDKLKKNERIFMTQITFANCPESGPHTIGVCENGIVWWIDNKTNGWQKYPMNELKEPEKETE